MSDGQVVEDGQQHLAAQLLQALRLLVWRHPLMFVTTPPSSLLSSPQSSWLSLVTVTDLDLMFKYNS